MKSKTIISFVFISFFILGLLGCQQSPSEYIIVDGNCLRGVTTSSGTEAVGEKVDKKLSEGYFPIGGVAFGGTGWCLQAMGK